jgi:predicted Zn finger-like uncharacterized protein
MFKVVTDQLKVSGGWVRCGHCAEVFDAAANLQTLSPPSESGQAHQQPAVQADTDSFLPADSSPVVAIDPDDSSRPAPDMSPGEQQTSWTPGASFADRAAPYVPAPAASTVRQADTGEDSGHSDFDPAAWKQKNQTESAAETNSSPANGMAGSPDEFPAPVSRAAHGVTVGAVSQIRASAADGPASEWPDDADTDVPDDVSFVRDAVRKAFWRKPAVRLVLAIVSFFLVLALAFQLVLYQRDNLAAMEPRLKPLLQAMCVQMRCELAPLKRIEVLVIDSSSFSKIGPDAYRLNFSVKNTGAVAVAMPSLEVTLTDTQEQPLVRRVVSPAQFGATSPTLPAGSDFAGLVVLQVVAGESSSATAGPLRIAGYRVLAFYP